MEKPQDYELKKWLCEHLIRGLIVHYYQTGIDKSDTDWELIPLEGKSKRVKADKVESLVTLRPDWVKVMTVTDRVKREVEEYREFAKREAADLAEFERLKKKFEG
jgi:hypothetical protein